MKRKWEVIIGIVGAVLCLIFLGGFSLTITSMKKSHFEKTVFPILQDSVSIEYVSESFEAVKELAAWFGVSLLIVLFLIVIATLSIWRNRYPKGAALFYVLAGAVTLIGTQFIAFPIAFLFFIAAVLCLFRKIGKEEDADYVSNKNRQSDFAGI